MPGGYSQDVLTNVVNVQWGTYHNTATYGSGRGWLAASHNGLDWTDIGYLLFDDGTGTSNGSGGIKNGEWLITQKLFVMRGWQVTSSDPNVRVEMGMSSSDGFTWKQCDSHFGEGDNTDELKEQHKPNETVNGYKFRVKGNEFTNDVGDILYADRIERSADGGQSWEVVTVPAKYSQFGPIRVLRGSGEGDVPVVICGTHIQQRDNKGGVLASIDGLEFTEVYSTGFGPEALMTGMVV